MLGAKNDNASNPFFAARANLKVISLLDENQNLVSDPVNEVSSVYFNFSCLCGMALDC
jgi:hypothetical protein